MRNDTVKLGNDYRMGVDPKCLDSSVPTCNIAFLEKVELPQGMDESMLYEPRYWTWKNIDNSGYWMNRMGAVVRELKNGGQERIKEYYAKKKGRYFHIDGKRYYLADVLF